MVCLQFGDGFVLKMQHFKWRGKAVKCFCACQGIVGWKHVSKGVHWLEINLIHWKCHVKVESKIVSPDLHKQASFRPFRVVWSNAIRKEMKRSRRNGPSYLFGTHQLCFSSFTICLIFQQCMMWMVYSQACSPMLGQKHLKVTCLRDKKWGNNGALMISMWSLQLQCQLIRLRKWALACSLLSYFWCFAPLGKNLDGFPFTRNAQFHIKKIQRKYWKLIFK